MTHEVEFLLFGLIIFCIAIILVCMAIETKNQNNINKTFVEINRAIARLKTTINEILDKIDNN